jgi:hypothetical protein
MHILALLLLATASLAYADNKNEGLFIADEAKEGTVAIEDGEMVLRQPATRLQPTKVVFRSDTDDPKKYWLEIHLDVYADPGDYYIFTIGGKEYTGFVVRSLDKKNNCKWALGFKDLAAGRELMKQIAVVYELNDKIVIDKT